MSSIAEIEEAIKKLPAPQVDELASWLETHRQRRATPPTVENWLQRARGAALHGETTAKVMALTRGEE
jgi:phytoene dehydrogenase-like protein